MPFIFNFSQKKDVAALQCKNLFDKLQQKKYHSRLETKHKKYVYYASASYANIKMNKAIDDYSRESTHLTNFVGVDVIPL